VVIVFTAGSPAGKSLLRMPHRGAILPKSTSSALSPLVCNSLGSLPSLSRNPTSAPPCARRQLTSPQITKWFRKSTPRKLAVTPKKSSSSTADAQPRVSRVKRKLCSDLNTNDSLAKNDVRLLSSENDRRLSPSKRQRSDQYVVANVLSPIGINCLQQSADLQVPDGTPSDVNHASNTSQSSFTDTPAAVLSFSSPTVNLPNYVFDPQPRAPVGRRLSPVKRRQSRDWLTQLRLDRQKAGSVQPSQPDLSFSGRGQRSSKTLKSSPRVGRRTTSASLARSTEPVSNCLLFIAAQL